MPRFQECAKEWNTLFLTLAHSVSKLGTLLTLATIVSFCCSFAIYKMFQVSHLLNYERKLLC